MMKRTLLSVLVFAGLFYNCLQAYSQADGTAIKLSIEKDSISGMQLKAVEGDEFTFYTKSLTPRMVTKPLEKALPEGTKVLSFEYICAEGLDVVNVWFGPDYDKEGKELIRRVAPAKDWKTCSIYLGDNMEGWGKAGDILRIDLGDDPDSEIKIRNIYLRPLNAEERQLAETKAAIKQGERRLSVHLRRYLAESYQSAIDSISVTADKVFIEGKSASYENTFLCEIPPYQDVTEEQNFAAVIPVKSARFSLQQDRFVKREGISYDRLLSKWALAKKTDSGYQLVSHAHFPDDIQSKYDLPREIPAGKKGLGGFYRGKGPVGDLDELGISSATVNIRFATFMYSKPAANRILHSYNGKDYYFDQKAVAGLDASLLETAKRNIIVAAILLVNKAEQCPDPVIGKLLQHPNMDPAGNYSMPNMTTSESVNCYAAALDFFASRYSLPDKKYGRIHHWIMHNEVNMGTEWTNMGNDVGELAFMDAYIKSMRMCYNIARAYNPHSEVMISVTKQWMWKSKPHFYLVKDLMDILLDYSKAEGDFQWGMANHPYPESLYEPKTWLDEKARFSLNTPLITFRNLEVLDTWIKLPEVLYKGKHKRTLWLSENGTNSRTYSEKDLAEQAAGFAYAWKKVESLSGIDAMQWHNWVDSRREYGLRIGLRRFPDDKTDPMGKKPVWYAYQAAGTPQENKVFDQYKEIIGISSWDETVFRGELVKTETAVGFNPAATFRMNNNIHYIPRDDRAQQKLIDDHVRKGYGGFATNMSYGDYLTPSGKETFKSFTEKAKAAGLELWLYDEQGYPSGNAGGRVYERNPDWEAMGIFNQDTLVKGGLLDYQVPPGEVIKAISVNNRDTLDVIDHIQNGRLKYKLPEGKWQVIVFSKSPLFKPFQVSLQPGVPRGRVNDRYPSLMIPEVTETFLEITHEAYADLMGKDLGKYFTSTFTDEPSLMAMSFAKKRWSVIPWAEVLSDSIKARYGYRPEDRLITLFEDEGPAGQQLRYQYFHTVADLFSKNYFKKIKEWCNQHNFKSGGHLLLEETMMAHVPLYGDIFACFREMDAPGIDALSCIPENTPVHTAKLASSAAELTGADRVMSEPCPVIDRRVLGKEPSTEEVRGFVNIQLTGGVTDFNNYLNLSNANDEEKKAFNEYTGRIGQHLRGGYSTSEVALLYPIESLWTSFIPESMQVVGWDSVSGGNAHAVEIEQAFRNTARFLFKNRWDYHCIDTKAIQDSKVIDGRLVHGNLSWKLVILPQVNTLPVDVWEKLNAFVRDGGYLVIMGKPPVNSTARFPDKVVQKISSGMLRHKNVFHFPEGNTASWNQTFGKALKKDITLANETLPIRYTHRVINGKQVYFVINDSANEQQTTLGLRNQAAYTLKDPIDGKEQSFTNGGQVKLKPYSGLVIYEK